MGTMDLPNETQFIALSDDDLKKLLARATAP
jgi:hypothetical protein